MLGFPMIPMIQSRSLRQNCYLLWRLKIIAKASIAKCMSLPDCLAVPVIAGQLADGLYGLIAQPVTMWLACCAITGVAVHCLMSSLSPCCGTGAGSTSCSAGVSTYLQRCTNRVTTATKLATGYNLCGSGCTGSGASQGRLA